MTGLVKPSLNDFAEQVAREKGISREEAVTYLLLGEPVKVPEDEMAEFLDGLQDTVARSLHVPKTLLGFPVVEVEHNKIVPKDWSVTFGYFSIDEPDGE